MKTDELKPVHCGCGGEPKTWEFTNGRWYVKCLKCSIGQMIAYPSEAEAITAWNKAMGAGLRERLEYLETMFYTE